MPLSFSLPATIYCVLFNKNPVNDRYYPYLKVKQIRSHIGGRWNNWLRIEKIHLVQNPWTFPLHFNTSSKMAVFNFSLYLHLNLWTRLEGYTWIKIILTIKTLLPNFPLLFLVSAISNELIDTLATKPFC